jgi:hypothetical protein
MLTAHSRGCTKKSLLASGQCPVKPDALGKLANRFVSNPLILLVEPGGVEPPTS